ncbi:ClpP-like prohead protease/major capsid protein fusion protein [Sphingomonas elodea]|uniref:ClpP-like prohead protease/major capsid protein fusion protein n=1 Tax=Sphingomonas elodea TaxID=179878 RepID=UPI00026321BA|nr:ClpP-like prohead protease/major capsid protein fusion protein [Sphingomonas elodea]
MAEILIYGIVGDSWDGLDANTLVSAISGSEGDLDIRINSPGGYVMEGLAIFNAIAREKAKGRKVTTHVDGLAASMGSVLAMAGNEIVMADNALMMIHNPWDCACGDANELRRKADQLDVLRDQLVGIYARQTGLTADELIPMLDAETWLTADLALAQGFITSIVTAERAVAACNVQKFGFRKAPESPLIAAAAMARTTGTAPAAPPQKKEHTMPQGTQPGGDNQPSITEQDVQARENAARAAERQRVSTIRALGTKHNLDAAFIDGLIDSDTGIDDARAKILDKLADAGDAVSIGHNSPARVTQDARDKFVEGATSWLLVKSGVASLVEKAAALKGEKVRIDPGEFRGMRNVDLAREAIEMAGGRVSARDPDTIVKDAITARGTITQTTSDFPILFENAVHKILQASYATTPDTWSRFCGIGSVTDFRAHTRYMRGSFSALDQVNEAGEFKNKPIPDLAKEQIIASTKGNIINLSRQAIVNDDMGVFTGLAVDLGRAAKLTIEVDVYALLAANPLMSDGFALFSSQHGNILTAAAPSVAAFDAARQSMAQQKDVSGNEFLDLRPAVWLGPLSLGGLARVTNGSQYDPDASNKLQRPNIVAGMFSDIVDTPRLSGTTWYVFGDPSVAPAIEVAFLNGVTEPFTDSQDGWRVDGVEWKVRHDYGVGAVNWRAAERNPGA